MSWLWNSVEKAESLRKVVVACASGKYPSSIAWAEPASIVYGTVLDASLLDAVRTTGNGELRYEYGARTITVAEGLVLEPGDHQVKAQVPETTTYLAAEVTRTIKVTRRPVTFTWKPNREGLKRGEPFTSARLVCTAVDGLDGSPVAGTVSYKAKSSATKVEQVLAPHTGLDAGEHTLAATFTPTDTAHFASQNLQVTVVVNVARARPEVQFTGPPSIVAHALLDDTAVKAAAMHLGQPVAGRCQIVQQPKTYSVTGGKVPPERYVVKFIPTDDTQYTEVTGHLEIQVLKATATVSWDKPADIVYGTLLSDLQLNLACSPTPGHGKLKYQPGAQSKLEGGVHTLSATVTLDDTYEPVKAQTVMLTVTPATPLIEWAPAPTNPNTALGDAQLNAKASFKYVNSSKQTMIEQVPGVFVYTPAGGANTHPAAGVQVLSARFTPTNSKNFSPVDATAALALKWATDEQVKAAGLSDAMRDKVLRGKFKKDGSLVGAHSDSILTDPAYACTYLDTNANGTRRYNVQKLKPGGVMSTVKPSTLPPAAPANWDDDAFVYATLRAAGAPGTLPDAKKRTTHRLAVAHPATGAVIPWEVVKNDRGEIIAAYPTG